MTTYIVTQSHYNVSLLYSSFALFQIRLVSKKTVLAIKSKKSIPKIKIEEPQGAFSERHKLLSGNYDSVHAFLKEFEYNNRIDTLVNHSKINYNKCIERSNRNYFKPRIVYEGPRNIIFWRRMKRPGKRS